MTTLKNIIQIYMTLNQKQMCTHVKECIQAVTSQLNNKSLPDNIRIKHEVELAVLVARINWNNTVTTLKKLSIYNDLTNQRESIYLMSRCNQKSNLKTTKTEVYEKVKEYMTGYSKAHQQECVSDLIKIFYMLNQTHIWKK